MDVQSVSVRAQDMAKLALDSIKLDKVVDTAFAAGTVWAVLSAVRNATRLAGPASYTAALGYLGGGLGVVGGVVNLACIGMSTYIATEGLCVDSGMVFVDRLIKEGVPEEDIYEVLGKLAISDEMKNKMIDRVHESFHGIYVASTVE